MISVILPTVRPHLIRRAFDSIAPAAGGLEFEVVLIADFMLKENLPCCRWIFRERRGVIDAINYGMKHAEGEYIFLFNDESMLDPNALRLLWEEAERDRRRLLGPRHVPDYTFRYYGLPFVPFPFAHRGLLDAIGGLVDPVYRGFYADPDLSMRAYAHGVPVQTIEAAVLYHWNGMDAPKEHSLSVYRAQDRETFRRRWDHLGAFTEC